MSYIICFWDKSKIQVSDLVGEKLKQAIKNESIKNFELGLSLYAISGIEKIIPKEEAYNTFPEETEYLRDMNEKRPSEGAMKVLESPKLALNLLNSSQEDIAKKTVGSLLCIKLPTAKKMHKKNKNI